MQRFRIHGEFGRLDDPRQPGGTPSNRRCTAGVFSHPSVFEKEKALLCDYIKKCSQGHWDNLAGMAVRPHSAIYCVLPANDSVLIFFLYVYIPEHVVYFYAGRSLAFTSLLLVTGTKGDSPSSFPRTFPCPASHLPPSASCLPLQVRHVRCVRNGAKPSPLACSHTHNDSATFGHDSRLRCDRIPNCVCVIISHLCLRYCISPVSLCLPRLRPVARSPCI